jgi:hypothetical protein
MQYHWNVKATQSLGFLQINIPHSCVQPSRPIIFLAYPFILLAFAECYEVITNARFIALCLYYDFFKLL